MGIVDELQKLEQLRANGTLTEDEFVQAKTRVLTESDAQTNPVRMSVIEEQLNDFRFEKELARIDREWEIKRRQFVIYGRYGRGSIPTQGTSIAGAVLGGAAGLLWTTMAFIMTSSSMGPAHFQLVGSLFPLFGIIFTIAIIGRCFYCYNIAKLHDAAYKAYKSRRHRVVVENVSTD